MKDRLLNQKDRFNHILKTLKKKLETGEWGPGDRLPTLPVLAETFKVSVATIREALRVLQSQGLISIEQGRGIFVNSKIDHITNLNKKDDTSFTIIDLMHLIEVRMVLEPSFAEAAAKQAFSNEINAICQSAEAMDELAKNNKSTVEEDMNFHMLIARATHNGMLIEIYEQLQEKLQAGRSHTNIPGMIEKATHYHTIIAGAIKDRDPQRAKMFMEAHIEANRELALHQFSN